jgi:hypothetical protein
MGIATEILNLRDQHISSVTELLAALDQVREAPVEKIRARVFIAGAVADLVLTNVAAHAADALRDQSTIPTRRVRSSLRRRSRRFDPGSLPRQRVLFA